MQKKHYRDGIKERRGRIDAVRMPSYNLMDYLKDRALLDYVAERSDFPIKGTPVGWVNTKRELLAERYGEDSKIRPMEASQAQIHTVFKLVYDRAKKNVAEYEKKPLINRLFEGFVAHRRMLNGDLKSKDNELLSERVVIMLDSCTELELIALERRLGRSGEKLLGSYAVRKTRKPVKVVQYTFGFA